MNILLVDACALINQPNYIFETQDKVIIHSITLEEMDSKADKSTTNGKNARTVINGLFYLWKNGNLLDGVKNANGGTIQFDFRTPKSEYLAFGYNPAKHDNYLISILGELEEEESKNNSENKVILVTGDRPMVLKASDHEVIYLAHEKFGDEFDKSKKYWKKDTVKRSFHQSHRN